MEWLGLPIRWIDAPSRPSISLSFWNRVAQRTHVRRSASTMALTPGHIEFLWNHDKSLNHTAGVGKCQRRSVWVEQSDEREGLAVGKPKSVKVTGGKMIDGRVYDTRDRILAKLWHQAQPWTGDRWTLTVYTIRETDGLSWEQVKTLMSHGL